MRAKEALQKALQSATQRLRGDEGNEVFKGRLREAANLICSEDCCDFALKEIQELMDRAASSGIDHRALLYVVDMVLRRADCSRDRNLLDPVASKARFKGLRGLGEVKKG